MSAGAEDDDALAARRSRHTGRPNLEVVGGQAAQARQRTPGARSARRPDEADHPNPEHHQHHILIEPEEDRWRWRRRIRQDPRKLFFYRWAVGFAGLFFIVLGLVTGPLPGPGGIPLVLLGLAVWASEFEWAHKLMMWFKVQLHRYRGWPAKRKVVFWICFITACGLLGYLYLLLIGFPSWMPQFMHDLADRLPGVG
ncbi:MAG TPA: PGPGW domain-containing protein [Microlunatus sp.]|nr:PGPGW domain-containing protein [Microlunatus sp.]